MKSDCRNTFPGREAPPPGETFPAACYRDYTCEPVTFCHKIARLRNFLATDNKIADPTAPHLGIQVTGKSKENEKVALFRSLFRGREDIYPKRFESKRTGKSGYQPVCRNVWIFFLETVPVKLARLLGSFMLTQAMGSRPEMGFDSYDRFFPSQDTMPKGGFGNLIALPLQKKAREKGNSLFVDGNLNGYSDQWAFLSSVRKMDFTSVQSIVHIASQQGGVLGV